MKFDLGIRCDYFLPVVPEGVSREIFLGVTKGRISHVGPFKKSLQKLSKKFIYAKDRLVLPGFVNAHTHLAMSLLRGKADDFNLNKWLYEYIFPVESKLVTKEFVEAGVSLSALELISSGVTTVCDMYYFSTQTAKVLDKAGLRGVICQALAGFPTPDDKRNDGGGWRQFEELNREYKNHNRIRPGLGPHAPYTCGDELLVAANKKAQDLKVHLQIHVAETKGEVEESLEKYKMTPTQRLIRLGFKRPGISFAHGVHLNSGDIKQISEGGVSIIHNPESNMKLGSGILNLVELNRAGVTVGLGTDGAASNNDQSILREMDSAAKLQKLSSGGNSEIKAKDILYMATLGGAKAIGLESEIGSLEVGKKADLVIFDLESPHLHPLNDLASLLVFCSRGTEVETVVCEGKILFEKRKFKTLNPKLILKKTEKFRVQINKFIGDHGA